MISQKLQEKIAVAERDWERARGRHPEGDGRRLAPMLKLAELYYQSGQRREALELFSASLSLYESNGLKDESKLDGILERLAITLSMDGRYAEAGPLFERLHELRVRRCGPSGLETGRVLCHMGTVRRSMNMVEESERLLDQSLRIALKHGRKGESLLSMVYSNLTGVYREQKKIQQAMECCRKSIELEGRLGGEGSLKQAGRYNNLGRLYLDLGEMDRAEECYLRSMEIRIKHHGHFHPDLVHNLVNLGELYCSKRDFDKAERYLFQAMSVAEKTLSPSDPMSGFVAYHMANMFAARGYIETAEEYYHRALDIIEKAMGTYFPEVGIIHLRLAQLMQRNGLWELSLEEAAKASDILQRVERSLDAPGRREMDELMAQALRALGRHREAEELLNKPGPKEDVDPARSDKGGDGPS